MPHSRRRRFTVHKNHHNASIFEASMQKNNILSDNINSKTELEPNNKRETTNVMGNSSTSNSNNKILKIKSNTKLDEDKVTTKNTENEIKLLDENKNTTGITDDEKKPNMDILEINQTGYLNKPADLINDNVIKTVKLKTKQTHRRENYYQHEYKTKTRSCRRKSITVRDPTKTIEMCTKDIGIAASTDIEQEVNSVDLQFTEPKLVTAIADLGNSVSNLYMESNTQTPVSIASQYKINADIEGMSDNSIGNMCRICHSGVSFSSEMGPLVSACSCRGTVGEVHVKCLERWLTESGKSRCELCGIKYKTRKVHKYGVPRSLMMWLFSQNAKQLMVDSLGIMLMSPLAVLAAWLSGKTLNGLITQENQVNKPWPLASTFVLACMTLVCYYCWVVSAATRHALAWWIWYRSQYEVRLQMLSEEILS